MTRRFSGEPIRFQIAAIQDPEHFAEHLADFRRGDEIAAHAERIGVV